MKMGKNLKISKTTEQRLRPQFQHEVLTCLAMRRGFEATRDREPMIKSGRVLEFFHPRLDADILTSI